MNRQDNKLIEEYRHSKDAEVLITEDANTHLGDYEFHYLNKEDKKELNELIKSVWKK